MVSDVASRSVPCCKMLESRELERALQDVFPFDPYDIQLGFMSNMYDCIENQQFGLFESPTGTGKTLSIICALLTWLKEHRKRLNAAISEGNAHNDTLGDKNNVEGPCFVPAWLSEGADDGSVQDSHGNSNDIKSRGFDCTPPSTSRGPRVIYAARTHSQLSQFMGASLFTYLEERMATCQESWPDFLCVLVLRKMPPHKSHRVTMADVCYTIFIRLGGGGVTFT
jgi:hypothetical protein